MAISSSVQTVIVTAYPPAPQVTVDFDGIPTIAIVSGTPNVAVSFDGTTDAMTLVAATKPNHTCRRFYRRVWLRLTTAGTADIEVTHES